MQNKNSSSPNESNPGSRPGASVKSVFALLCGLFFFVPFIGVIAIPLGYAARREIGRSNGELKGLGMALAGIILGYLSVAVVVVSLLVILTAGTGLILPRRPLPGDPYAVGSLRTISTAQKVYTSTYPEEGYSFSLEELGGSGGSPRHAGLIDQGMSTGQSHGYWLLISGCDHQHYNLEARPKDPGKSGLSMFCTDETGLIRKAPPNAALTECLKSGEVL